jgi:hypothetical protein
VVLIALRHIFRAMAENPGSPMPDLTKEWLEAKVRQSAERSRRNFVRRIYSRSPLFGLSEIQERYPDYTEQLLLQDLPVKSKKDKVKKHQPVTDLRRCQLEKLAAQLRLGGLGEQAYTSVCNRIVMLQNAHQKRLPIPLAVTFGGETLVYSFNWKTREGIVKSFVELANSSGMTHDRLKQKYQEIIGSPYSI